MTSPFEDFKNYIPKYLNTTAQQKLFDELKQFPHNIDGRIYSQALLAEQNVFQGDGLNGLWVTNLPDPRIDKARVMVLSNTCDISPQNRRFLPPNIFYCPVVSLAKYHGLLKGNLTGFSDAQIDSHINSIRAQEVSSLFFLPSNAKLGEDCIALLDRINNCDSRACDIADLLNNRLFTLSNYGFYLFLYKLSVHFSRLRESLDRNPQLN
jgi:hypothetical protein